MIQIAPRSRVAELVTTPEFTTRHADRLREGLETFLGPGVAAEIAEVDDIPLEPSGKRLAVKSEVPA